MQKKVFPLQFCGISYFEPAEISPNGSVSQTFLWYYALVFKIDMFPLAVFSHPSAISELLETNDDDITWHGIARRLVYIKSNLVIYLSNTYVVVLKSPWLATQQGFLDCLDQSLVASA